MELGNNSLWDIDFYSENNNNYELITRTGSLRSEKTKAFRTNLFWLTLPLGFSGLFVIQFLNLSKRKTIKRIIQIFIVYYIIINSPYAGETTWWAGSLGIAELHKSECLESEAMGGNPDPHFY
jgi:hypothetical protein